MIDSSTTSSCGHPHDLFLTTGQLLHKIFHTLFGQQAAATKQKELLHKHQKLVSTTDIILTLKSSHTLLSTSKFADANYITMLTLQPFYIKDGKTTNITARKPPVLIRWRKNISRLLHVLLHLEPSTLELTNNIFELDNKQQIIAYYHAAAGYQ